MTLAEFISWQGYFKAKAADQAKPPPLPELGALGPAGIAHALGGR
jgi:hypothetical protein